MPGPQEALNKQHLLAFTFIISFNSHKTRLRIKTGVAVQKTNGSQAIRQTSRDAGATAPDLEASPAHLPGRGLLGHPTRRPRRLASEARPSRARLAQMKLSRRSERRAGLAETHPGPARTRAAKARDLGRPAANGKPAARRALFCLKGVPAVGPQVSTPQTEGAPPSGGPGAADRNPGYRPPRLSEGPGHSAGSPAALGHGRGLLSVVGPGPPPPGAAHLWAQPGLAWFLRGAQALRQFGARALGQELFDGEEGMGTRWPLFPLRALAVSGKFGLYKSRGTA